MSKITTGSINSDYPVPGVVNTTQGFRTNFASIKQNLELANTEITELQQKTIVKKPLNNVAINNDMAGTLISNALINNFRHTTKNLGNNISGNLTIDISSADVQFAGISDSVNIQFVNWPQPTSNQAAVQSNCQLIFNRVNNVSPLNIYFPATVNQGTTTIENYNGNGIGGFVTMAANVSQLHFNFTTVNQGSNIEIQPMDRPRIPELIPMGEVVSVGLVADNPGFLVTGSPVTSNGVITIKNTGVTTINAGANIVISGSTGEVVVRNIANISRIPMGIPSPMGSPGDSLGQVYADNDYLYVCTANYDGGNPIWKRATMQVSPVPIANFTANTLAGTPPLTVAFTDTSTNSPTSWSWDFQNNGSVDSTNQNPVYTYTTPGIYSVKLTSTNSAGSNSQTKQAYISVGNPPAANFTASPVTGAAPLTVEFTDTSTNNPASWNWDFQNNGSTDSTFMNPVYTFATPGTYTVKLTSTNPYGSNTIVKSNFINVTTTPAPVPPPPPPGPAPSPTPVPPPPPFNTSGWTTSWTPNPLTVGETISTVSWSVNNAPDPVNNSVQIVFRSGNSSGPVIVSLSPYGISGSTLVGTFASGYVGNLYAGIQLWTSASQIGQTGQLIAEKGVTNQLVAPPPGPPPIAVAELSEPVWQTLAYGTRSGPTTYKLESVWQTSPPGPIQMGGRTYSHTEFKIVGSDGIQTVDVVGYPVPTAGRYYYDMASVNINLTYNLLYQVSCRFVATDGTKCEVYSNVGTTIRYSY